MTRSERLNPVIKVADNKERQAARFMGDSLRDLEDQKKKLDELATYRDDYAQRFTDAGKSGLSISQMNEYRRFITKINEAIVLQRRKINETQLEYEQRRLQWTDLHSRTRALDKVATRFREAERRQDAKKEQKQLDENALNRRSLFTE